MKWSGIFDGSDGIHVLAALTHSIVLDEQVHYNTLKL